MTTPKPYTPNSNLLITKQMDVLNRNYNTTITIVDALLYRQLDTIRMIEFYTNSRYFNGQLDELGREKPFYNIVNSMCDVENAAKDIDTKDITAISADGRHYTESFLMTKDIQEWMRESNFAKTLNDMRDTHTKYGSLLVKKCMETDENGESQLYIGIPEWKNTITDQINIEKGAIIECHWMLPNEMVEMKSWSNVTDAIVRAVKNGYNTRVPVYEVRGWFPRVFYKQVVSNSNSYTQTDISIYQDFSYQLYYFAGQWGQQDTSSDVIGSMTQNATINLFNAGNLIPLYWEDDTEQVYKYLARKPRAGRGFGVGVVEEGEEAQVWTNDAVLKQFRAMEYTTKVVGQTASKKLKGRNMLSEVIDGQILEHEDGKPITSLSLLPSGGLTQYSTLINQWFIQYERATSAYGAQRGESPTSRTSSKLQSAVLSQSGAVFSDLKEEMGIFYTEIFEDWIMPFLVKKLTPEHILSHDFSLGELAEIDRNFAMNTANEQATQMILDGKLVTEEDYANFVTNAKQAIQTTKSTRFLNIPKNYYKKIKPKIVINITGEQQDKNATIQALSLIMKTYAANPEIVDDPVLTMLFMEIVELTGANISPVNFIAAIQEKKQQQAQAAAAGAVSSNDKVAEAINFKDLPPEGQQQMAAKVGIKIQPPAPVVPPGGVPNASPALPQ